MASENYLFISDLQIPYEHEKALLFCKYLKQHFNIRDENCYCVGDEIDSHWGALFKPNPNATHSPKTELQAAREKLRQWYDIFPQMKLAISNHGTRWLRKATDAQIPSELMRQYRDVLEAPPGWQWQKHWIIRSRKPMVCEHGDDHGGTLPHKNASLINGMSTVMGHHHSLAGVEHLKTNGMEVWGMVTGSLIDFEAYAFDYARGAKFKPKVGCGVVLDSGRIPIWMPLD